MQIKTHTRFRKATGKRGSLIVEAAAALPVFMTAMIVLSSILLYYAAIEDANFILATEMIRGSAEEIAVSGDISVPFATMQRVSDAHSAVRSQWVSDYGYRVTRGGNDELIAVSIRMNMTTDNPLGLAAKASYQVSLMTRAYVGKTRSQHPMSETEFMSDSEAVYIFPKDGVRYHKRNCTFVRSACSQATLTPAVRRRYTGCSVCRSGSAEDGALIYVYPAYGETYHLPGCVVLDRNFIEIEKRIAVRRGYTPCSKCGG